MKLLLRPAIPILSILPFLAAMPAYAGHWEPGQDEAASPNAAATQAGGTDSTGDAASQIREIVESALAGLARKCPAIEKPGYASPCDVILPRLTWKADPQMGSVVFIYRDPGTPFSGKITAGSSVASHWDGVTGDLRYLCTDIAGAIHSAGWPAVPVYVFAYEKAPSHYFGPTTDDGEAEFLRLGPQYGGGCGPF